MRFLVNLILPWLARRLTQAHLLPGKPARAFLKRLLFGWPMRIALAGFATLIAPAVYIVGLISVIGIPIALIAMLVPAAAALYASAELLYRFAFRRALPRRMAVGASLAIPLAVAIIVAQLANAALDGRAAALIAGDRDSVTAGPIGRLAIIGAPSFNKNASSCREICLRLLLTGAVEEVLLAGATTPIETIDPRTEAIAIRLRKSGEPCASKHVEGGDEKIEDDATASAAELMRLRIAGGECLEERSTTLAAADAAIVSTEPARGNSPASAGLDAFANTLRAERLAFFRNQNGAFREDYRRTLVWVDRHLPIATPAVVNGHMLEAQVAFLRLTRRLNVGERFEARPDRAKFLRERVGLDLSLATVAAPDRRALIDRYIAGEPADDAAARGVIEDFIEEASPFNRAPARADAERVVALFKAPHIELPHRAASAVASIGPTYPDLAAVLADALFARIEAATPGARQSHYNDPLIKIAARALMRSPDATLAERRARIMPLLADKERRIDAAPLFSRLSVGGADAVSDLLAVIDAAIEERARDEDGEGWRDLYVAGISGLCHVASLAVGDGLLARVDRDPSLKPIFRHRIIMILIKSGRSEADVRALYVSGLDERGLKSLDDEIDHARRFGDCD